MSTIVTPGSPSPVQADVAHIHFVRQRVIARADHPLLTFDPFVPDGGE